MRPNDVAALLKDHLTARIRLQGHDLQTDLNDENELALPDHLVNVEGKSHALRRVLPSAANAPATMVYLERRGEV